MDLKTAEPLLRYWSRWPPAHVLAARAAGIAPVATARAPAQRSTPDEVRAFADLLGRAR